MAQFTGSGSLIVSGSGNNAQKLYDLEFQGGSLVLDGALNVEIAGCRFGTSSGTGILMTEETGYVQIHDNVFDLNGDGIDGGGFTIGEGIIDGNVFYLSNRSITNVVANSINKLIITNNHMFNNQGAEPCVLLSVDEEGGTSIEIAGNVMWQGGVFISAVPGDLPSAINVHDNTLDTVFAQHAIHLDGCVAAQVHHNTIKPSVGMASTDLDGIHLSGCSSVMVDHNTVNPFAQFGDPMRFGINVASGDCNIVVGNNLGDPADYGTDALNDDGTDTQLTYPDDPVYGSNFVGCSS